MRLLRDVRHISNCKSIAAVLELIGPRRLDPRHPIEVPIGHKGKDELRYPPLAALKCVDEGGWIAAFSRRQRRRVYIWMGLQLHKVLIKFTASMAAKRTTHIEVDKGKSAAGHMPMLPACKQERNDV